MVTHFSGTNRLSVSDVYCSWPDRCLFPGQNERNRLGVIFQNPIFNRKKGEEKC